jgi:predicted MPP superfamily phosphohydrolase
MRKYFYIIILVIILLFLYAKYIEPNNLIVNEYSVYTENIDDSYNDFKIMQFSDLLYSGNSDNKMLQKIVNKINMYRPDIVIFTGNLFNENYNLNDEDEKYIEEELNNITVNISKIAIFGSNDNNNQNQYQEIMNNSNFIILNNSSKYVFYKSNYPIEITNIEILIILILLY